MAKPLPPYGREVLEAMQQPKVLEQFTGCTRERATVWIATGFEAWDWREAHPHHLCIVMPYGKDPFAYRWDFLKDHEPPLILPPVADHPEQRRALAGAILADGVATVLACAGMGGVRYSQ